MCKFRHLLEQHGLGAKIFARVNGYLESRRLKLGTGTIVDATLIEAPSSTKNKQGERDPEMHQVRKGNQWHFGMKAHVGMDAETKLVHSVAATPANVADAKMLPALLRGDETAAWGDQAYQARMPCWPDTLPWLKTASAAAGAPNCPCVEHGFAVLKLRFGFVKVRYRGLAKNLHRLYVSFALVNLVPAQKPSPGSSVSTDAKISLVQSANCKYPRPGSQITTKRR